MSALEIETVASAAALALTLLLIIKALLEIAALLAKSRRWPRRRGRHHLWRCGLRQNVAARGSSSTHRKNIMLENEKPRGNGTFHNSILVQPEGGAFFRASVFYVELD